MEASGENLPKTEKEVDRKRERERGKGRGGVASPPPPPPATKSAKQARKRNKIIVRPQFRVPFIELFEEQQKKKKTE